MNTSRSALDTLADIDYEAYITMLSKFKQIMRDQPLLIVMHPADLASIPPASETVDLQHRAFVPSKTFAGIETWGRIQIERGHPHIYRSWASAIVGLKDLLPNSDLEELVRRLQKTNSLKKKSIDSETSMIMGIVKQPKPPKG